MKSSLSPMDDVLSQADHHFQTGNFPAAHRAYTQALALARKQRQINLMQAAMLGLGRTAGAQREFSQAHRFLEEALALARTSENRVAECQTLIAQGMLSWKAGQFAQARVAFRQALGVANILGDERTLCAVYSHLGNLAYAQSEYTHALVAYQTGLNLACRIGERRYEGIFLNNLGSVAHEQDRYPVAEDYYTRSVRVIQELEDPRLELILTLGLTELALHQGQYGTALKRSAQIFKLQSKVTATQELVRAWTVQGQVFFRLGHYAKAHDCFRHGLSYLKESAASNSLAQGELLLHLVYLTSMRGDRAFERHYALAAVPPSQGGNIVQRRTFQGLGQMHFDFQEWEQAEAAYQAALTLCVPLTDPSHKVATLAIKGELAAIALARGRMQVAQQYGEDIYAQLGQVNLYRDALPIRIWLRCYQIFTANGDRRASEILQRGYQAFNDLVTSIPDPTFKAMCCLEIPYHYALAQAWQLR